VSNFQDDRCRYPSTLLCGNRARVSSNLHPCPPTYSRRRISSSSTHRRTAMARRRAMGMVARVPGG